MTQLKADNLIKAPDQSKDPYDVWKARPTSSNLNLAVKHLGPTIQSAMTTHAGGNVSPILKGHAKTLAIKAIRSYDPQRGASLQSHVSNQLKPLSRYNQKSSQAVTISERRMRQFAELSRADQEFMDRHGREPTDDELADRMGLSAKRIGRIRASGIPTGRTDVSGPETLEPTTNRQDPLEVWVDYVYHDADSVDRKILDWKLGRGGQPVLNDVEIAARLKLSPRAIGKRTVKLQTKLMEGMQGVS